MRSCRRDERAFGALSSLLLPATLIHWRRGVKFLRRVRGKPTALQRSRNRALRPDIVQMIAGGGHSVR
jgi:hypothetical protein